MKKILFSVLIIISSLASFGQMKSNGKLNDIRKATKQNVMKAMTGEFGHDNGTENFSIKIDLQGNFKMFYSYNRKSRSFNESDGGWTLQLSGKVTLYDADFVRRKEQIKDKYGDIINTNSYYTKYHAVFSGTDQKGREHSFCCTIDQMFDNQHMYAWQMSWTDNVPNCYCEDTNAAQSVRIPFATDLH